MDFWSTIISPKMPMAQSSHVYEPPAIRLWSLQQAGAGVRMLNLDVFPANTNATAIMIAEKAAEWI